MYLVSLLAAASQLDVVIGLKCNALSANMVMTCVLFVTIILTRIAYCSLRWQVAVVGPSGCGKTECIKTVAAAHREMGRIIRRDIICTGALESRELMGYYDTNTR